MRYSQICGLVLSVAVLALSACKENKDEPQSVRPVRSVAAEPRQMSDSIVLTGQIRARREVNLAFQLTGKIITGPAEVGDEIKVGQVVARLENDTERNTRDAAQADLAAARAVLTQAQTNERRLAALAKERAVSHMDYEDMERQMKTAREQVRAASARLDSAETQLGYTVLRATADSVVVAKHVEAGEVVGAGSPVITLAQHGGLDAYFDAPAELIRQGLRLGQQITVRQIDNPAITAVGAVREIAPQADPITRTYRIKVGLPTTRDSMLLGSTVVGELVFERAGMEIDLPASAMVESNGKPAVWVIAPDDSRVHLRPVAVSRYGETSVTIGRGLQSGERVVTAGVQVLHEGQQIRLLGASQ